MKVIAHRDDKLQAPDPVCSGRRTFQVEGSLLVVELSEALALLRRV
jgi:hypothetical protein